MLMTVSEARNSSAPRSAPIEPISIGFSGFIRFPSGSRSSCSNSQLPSRRSAPTPEASAGTILFSRTSSTFSLHFVFPSSYLSTHVVLSSKSGSARVRTSDFPSRSRITFNIPS